MPDYVKAQFKPDVDGGAEPRKSATRRFTEQFDFITPIKDYLTHFNDPGAEHIMPTDLIPYIKMAAENAPGELKKLLTETIPYAGSRAHAGRIEDAPFSNRRASAIEAAYQVANVAKETGKAAAGFLPFVGGAPTAYEEYEKGNTAGAAGAFGAGAIPDVGELHNVAPLLAGLPLARKLGKLKYIPHHTDAKYVDKLGRPSNYFDLDKLRASDLFGAVGIHGVPINPTDKGSREALQYADSSYANKLGTGRGRAIPIDVKDKNIYGNTLDLMEHLETDDLATAIAQFPSHIKRDILQRYKGTARMPPVERQQALAKMVNDAGYGMPKETIDKLNHWFDAYIVNDIGYKTVVLRNDAPYKTPFGAELQEPGKATRVSTHSPLSPRRELRPSSEAPLSPEGRGETGVVLGGNRIAEPPKPEYVKEGKTTGSGFPNTPEGQKMQAKYEAAKQAAIDKMTAPSTSGIPKSFKGYTIDTGNGIYQDFQKYYDDFVKGKHNQSWPTIEDFHKDVLVNPEYFGGKFKISAPASAISSPEWGEKGIIEFKHKSGKTTMYDINSPATQKMLENAQKNGMGEIVAINGEPYTPPRPEGPPKEQHYDFGPDFGHITKKEANQFYSAGELSNTAYNNGLEKPVNEDGVLITKEGGHKLGDTVKFTVFGVTKTQKLDTPKDIANLNALISGGAKVVPVEPVSHWKNWKIDSPYGKGLSVEETFKKGNYANVYKEGGIEQFVDDLEHAETQGTTFKIDKNYKNTATKLKEAVAKLDPLQDKPYGDSKFTNKDYIHSAFQPGDSFGMTAPDGTYYTYQYNSHADKADLEKLIKSGHKFADYGDIPEGEPTSALGWQQHGHAPEPDTYDLGDTSSPEWGDMYNFNGEYLTESEAAEKVHAGELTQNQFENKFGHLKPFDNPEYSAEDMHKIVQKADSLGIDYSDMNIHDVANAIDKELEKTTKGEYGVHPKTTISMPSGSTYPVDEFFRDIFSGGFNEHGIKYKGKEMMDYFKKSMEDFPQHWEGFSINEPGQKQKESAKSLTNVASQKWTNLPADTPYTYQAPAIEQEKILKEAESLGIDYHHMSGYDEVQNAIYAAKHPNLIPPEPPPADAGSGPFAGSALYRAKPEGWSSIDTSTPGGVTPANTPQGYTGQVGLPPAGLQQRNLEKLNSTSGDVMPWEVDTEHPTQQLYNTPFNPQGKVQELTNKYPELANLYAMDSGTEIGDVGTHTQDVLNNWNQLDPAAIKKAGEQLGVPDLHETLADALALHDIGKGDAVAAGNKDLQHEFTIPRLEYYLQQQGHDPKAINFAKELFNHDIIGGYAQGKGTQGSVVDALTEKAKKLGIDTKTFMDVQMPLYFADAGSYPYVKNNFMKISPEGKLSMKDPKFDTLQYILQNNPMSGLVQPPAPAIGEAVGKKLASSEIVRSGKSPNIYIPKDVEFLKNLGGGHGAQLLNYGGVPHVFKPQAPGDVRGIQEVYGSKIASLFSQTPPVEQVNIPGYGQGTLQKYYQGSKPAPGLNSMTGSQLGDVAEHQPIDYAIGNWDAHPENWIQNDAGLIVPIDKGQSFKYWTAEHPSPDYHPNAQYGSPSPIYRDLVKYAPEKQYFANEMAKRVQGEGSKLMDYYSQFAKERYPDDAYMQDLFKDYHELKLKSLPETTKDFWNP